MQIYPDSIGEYADDGSVKTEAANDPFRGLPVTEQHHVVQRLDKTHFVRIFSQDYSKYTEDVRADLLASLQPKSVRAKMTADAAKEQQHGD